MAAAAIVIECRPQASREQIRSLSAGASVEISGELLTIRDATAKRLVGLIESGGQLPVDLASRLLLAAGPSPARPGQIVGSAGPTTTERLTKFLPQLLNAGVHGIIGKGELHGPVVDVFREHGAVYLAAIGGLGALLAQTIIAAEVVAFPDLGTEAMYRFNVEAFPAIVIIDVHGNNFHETARRKWRRVT